LKKLLELNDFRILRDSVYSDEKTLSVFILELEQQVIPGIKRHLGPPIRRKSECDRFIAKYVGQNSVISGPYIENGRWIVDLSRKHVNAVELLRSALKKEGKNMGIADLVIEALGKGFTITANEGIAEVYKGNEGFAVFLTEFLDGKPSWLQTAETQPNQDCSHKPAVECK
jgi:tRNA nucleotidyltransferase (CCA-adding enzyme)